MPGSVVGQERRIVLGSVAVVEGPVVVEDPGNRMVVANVHAIAGDRITHGRNHHGTGEVEIEFLIRFGGQIAVDVDRDRFGNFQLVRSGDDDLVVLAVVAAPGDQFVGYLGRPVVEIAVGDVARWLFAAEFVEVSLPIAAYIGPPDNPIPVDLRLLIQGVVIAEVGGRGCRKQAVVVDVPVGSVEALPDDVVAGDPRVEVVAADDLQGNRIGRGGSKLCRSPRRSFVQEDLIEAAGAFVAFPHDVSCVDLRPAIVRHVLRHLGNCVGRTVVQVDFLVGAVETVPRDAGGAR